MRAESYNSSINNYELVQEALYTFIEEKGGPGIKANDLHKQMNKFYFFFGLKLDYLLFSAEQRHNVLVSRTPGNPLGSSEVIFPLKTLTGTTEELSRIIQSSSCCLQDVLSSAESLIRYFERIRGKTA
ncbi:unnamed protein product [Rotaria magnacalcarata]|uniref:Uncharacterized protein n=1 Tax=Rotaria magnacalcarata TaxID=392030 RepID=A0A8S3B4G5_9BILA|nr:unnamed protein product [Rotaria magnacalcarata]